MATQNRTRLTLATISGLVLVDQLAETLVSGGVTGSLGDWLSNLFAFGFSLSLFGGMAGIVLTIASTGLKTWLARGHVGVMWEKLLLTSSVGAGLLAICHPMSLFTILSAWANTGSVVPGLRFVGVIFGFGFIPGLLFGGVFCLLSWSIRKWPRVNGS